MPIKGIDVSEFQGEIDWSKVKNDNVDFAILRLGFGMNVDSQDDKYIERNIKECENLDIPYGVYLFSYADSLEKAKSEAEHTLRIIKGHNLAMGVWYDIEDNNTSGKVGKKELADIIEKYCSTIKAEGYEAGIYANLNWFENKIESSVQKKYPIWVAQYYKECQYEGDYLIWQYSADGEVNGILGNVDMNYYYGEIEENKDKKSVEELANEVLDGKWGNGEYRKKRLEEEGYSYNAVQDRVNELLSSDNDSSIDKIVNDVISGKYGNGEERKKKLEAEGYNYNTVQNKVNEILGASLGKTYTVKDGDTLSEIAAKYNTTVEKLVKDNDISNPDLIYAGQKIVIK